MAHRLKSEYWYYPICGFPSVKGVYCVMLCNIITLKNKVLYIGSSSNLSNRLSKRNHPYRMLLPKYDHPLHICCKIKESENNIDLERILIKKLKPTFNIQNAGKRSILNF